MDRPRVVDREPERYEPVEAPDAPTFPTAEPSYDGERGYEPIKPRSGIGDLFRKLAAPFVAFGLLVLKFGGLLLKFKVVTTFSFSSRPPNFRIRKPRPTIGAAILRRSSRKPDRGLIGS